MIYSAVGTPDMLLVLDLLFTHFPDRFSGMTRGELWTGRRIFRTPFIRAHFYQGPLGGQGAEIHEGECRVRFGRVTLRVADAKDPRGYVDYAQARRLPRGYGVSERWMTINRYGEWCCDEERYDRGDYDPREQEMPWEEHGAEGDPGGTVE